MQCIAHALVALFFFYLAQCSPATRLFENLSDTRFPDQGAHWNGWDSIHNLFSLYVLQYLNLKSDNLHQSAETRIAQRASRAMVHSHLRQTQSETLRFPAKHILDHPVGLPTS